MSSRQSMFGGAPLLELNGVTVRLPVEGSMQPVLQDVSFTIRPGEALGLVGESGSGKSMTARAIDRLLPPGAAVAGLIQFGGRDVMTLSGADFKRFRGEVAMIFQDPRAHTNPVRRIGDFMTEALRTNAGVPMDEAARRAVVLLRSVGIEDGERRLRQYPHELSGGLLQRVMIATALLTQPRLLLADEPTTALDVTTQAEVLAILDNLRSELRLAMLFITHNLELAAAICDRTVVMDSTAHRLTAITGRPLSAFEAPLDACAFTARCPHAADVCRQRRPALVELDGGLTRCARASELFGRLKVQLHA
jgi:ABC-type dipeptide/oligopeptide/nickel transport system ATPase component